MVTKKKRRKTKMWRRCFLAKSSITKFITKTKTVGQRLRAHEREKEQGKKRRSRGRPGYKWRLLFHEWVHSGKSRKAFCIEKFGYFAGTNHKSTCDWPERLIEHCKETSFSELGSVATFVAQFGAAYDGAISVDKAFMSCIDLGPAMIQAANAAGCSNDIIEGPTIEQALAKVPKEKPEPIMLDGVPIKSDFKPGRTPSLGLPATSPPINVEAIVKSDPEPPISEIEVDLPSNREPPSPQIAIGRTFDVSIIKPGDDEKPEEQPEPKPSPQPAQPQPEVIQASATTTFTDKQTQDTWALIQQWRSNQATQDWKTAEAIRNHIRMLTTEGVKITQTKDGTKRYESKLTPGQVLNLAETAAVVQRIQRLAIGLSTENIGIDMPQNAGDATHLAKPDDADTLPLFVVEMNQQGKFVRQRPRRVN